MKNKEIRYYVIGGQYAALNYGGAATLLGAKRLASRCVEYWDNWQGWHVPAIYASSDCSLQTNFFGENYLPNAFANPVAMWSATSNKWIRPDWDE